MPPEIWIVEIRYFDGDTPDIRKNGLTVVTTWASDTEEFAEKCQRMSGSHGWHLLGVERASPASIRHDYSDEVKDMLERTRVNPNAIIYGTFYE